ncbi:MAG: glycosyltransferase family 4 protein [Anaerolineaceae bacterium]|nr:glycosyltransferase family 4 protein [Anaerolineaceae bacterium]
MEIHIVDWEESKEKISWLDYLNLRLKFKKVIKEVQPDIIHAGPIQRVAFLPALTSFHPLISMSWGFDLLQDAYQNIFWKKLTQYVLRKSDWVLVDCQMVKQTAIKFGFSEEKITVFPWGVDLNQFSPDSGNKKRKKLGFENDFLIIHTRSWEPRYGVDVALRGFQIAAVSTPNLHMIMLGGGSQEKQVKDFINAHGLSDQIHFYGYQKNERLAEYYQAADAYLSASHIDGSSVALMESMACGCPALVSDIPSNLEWISDGVEGWVFRDGDAEDLAKKILTAVHMQKETGRFGKAARLKAERFANWDNSIEKLLETYQTVSDLYEESIKTDTR